ncbi:MAG: hypothetical protein WD530_00170, partial [Vicingaceae bacterium]
ICTFVACSSDDSNSDGDTGTQLFAKFELSGGGIEQGLYEGENPLVAINTNPEEGATIDLSTTRPTEEEAPFWRLDIASAEGANYPLTVGTYTLGNLDNFIDGNVDFYVAFQSHDVPNQSWPYVWGALGDVQGTLTITEIQTGVLDNGTRDIISGTFEFTASDNNIDGTIDQPPLDDIIVTNGEFRAKMGAF